ncbi:glycosyltransferase [Aliirhizobium terrae]|uniref:glycosyltransferase n=1 Tax=Terrirhizobium terrae TaxID=2926709 RepID=UPI002574E40B|nr:glycosyltransferase [Rhizobium sp. CC-CFT758]WJH39064.1 glycosyltransferase [Rhizobium sp. CC-CFT758]
MLLRVIPNNDLKLLDGAEVQRQTWASTGDDPAFVLRYGFIRRPYVVVEIYAAGGQMVHPKIYFDKGHGFREKDAVTFTPGERFVITLKLSSVGNGRRVRIDPCHSDAIFQFTAKAFRSLSEAEAYVGNIPDISTASQPEVIHVPPFRFRLPAFSINKRPLIDDFARSTYNLAARLQPIGKSEASPWLSVVVPVYNAPARYLDDLIASFESQDECGWELILSDDASTSEETHRSLSAAARRENITVVRNEHNGGIAVATNNGLAMAKGQWVTFVDHDDLLGPHALKVIRRALADNPNATFIYTDELVVDDGLKLSGAMLKPAYDPVLLTGVNYINHLSLYRHDRLKEIGYLREGYDGSQDYELLLRYLDGVGSEDVLHLPYPAYWWRRTGTTYSRKFLERATKNARAAIADRLGRSGLPTEVGAALTPTLHRPLLRDSTFPKVSIIIPSKDSPALITRILEDLFDKTDYPDFEVIVVDNGTTDPAVLALYDVYRERYHNFKAEIVLETFNFARSVNRGQRLASGEHFLILNNDIEVLEPSWLKEMVSCLKFEKAGIVGAKLLFPDDTIQHAGVVVGFGGLAGHWYLNQSGDYGGPMNRLHVRSSMSCVTGAVMLISGDCWSELGPWDEEHFAVAYNDVDYCLRGHKLGFRIIWTPFACLCHHESLSRGAEVGKEKKIRFEKEKQYLRDLHGTLTFDDPASNPNFTKDRSTPRLAIPEKLHSARPWDYDL